MSAEVGSKAPDFTLMNQDREPVTLSAERGHPVVLAFFPAAYSGTCIKELCTFRDNLARFNNAKAKVYGISVDTFFALKAFQTDQKLTFPLLSDFNKDVIRAYGAFNEDMIGLKGIAKRSTFGRRGPIPGSARRRQERARLSESVRRARLAVTAESSRFRVKKWRGWRLGAPAPSHESRARLF